MHSWRIWLCKTPVILLLWFSKSLLVSTYIVELMQKSMLFNIFAFPKKNAELFFRTFLCRAKTLWMKSKKAVKTETSYFVVTCLEVKNKRTDDHCKDSLSDFSRYCRRFDLASIVTILYIYMYYLNSSPCRMQYSHNHIQLCMANRNCEIRMCTECHFLQLFVFTVFASHSLHNTAAYQHQGYSRYVLWGGDLAWSQFVWGEGILASRLWSDDNVIPACRPANHAKQRSQKRMTVSICIAKTNSWEVQAHSNFQ